MTPSSRPRRVTFAFFIRRAEGAAAHPKKWKRVTTFTTYGETSRVHKWRVTGNWADRGVFDLGKRDARIVKAKGSTRDEEGGGKGVVCLGFLKRGGFRTG